MDLVIRHARVREWTGPSTSASGASASRASPPASPSGAAAHDAEATLALRGRLRARRGPLPFFDRGPGYRRRSGRHHAEVDLLQFAPRTEPEGRPA